MRVIIMYFQQIGLSSNLYYIFESRNGPNWRIFSFYQPSFSWSASAMKH